MPLALAHRRTGFNRCNPDQPLDPKDDRNYDIDTVAGAPRGRSWVDELASSIELSDTPVMVLYTGLPGSGKSTELRRLTERLSDPNGANLLPVLVDAEQLLDLNTPIDVPDILLAALYAADREVLLEEHKNPANAMKESLFQRLGRWWTKGEVGAPVVAAGVAVADPAQVLQAELQATWTLRADPSLLKQMRERAALRFGEFLSDVRDAFEKLHLRATELDASRAGIVLVFDSLEKLRGLTTNWALVLESAERLFRNDALKLPIHVVYTVPPALTFRLAQPVVFMPMIKLWEGPRSPTPGAPYGPGYEASVRLLEKRVPDAWLADLLGPEFAERRKELIRWSGGYPREMVRLVQNLFTRGTWSKAEFEAFLEGHAEPYRRVVPDTAYDWLADVAINKNVVINDANRATADQMLGENVVLRYCNATEWFDLHPAVLHIDGLKAAIERKKTPPPAP